MQDGWSLFFLASLQFPLAKFYPRRCQVSSTSGTGVWSIVFTGLVTQWQMEKLNLSPNLNRYSEWYFLSCPFPDAECQHLRDTMVLVKNIRKTDMPPKWSLIILQMYYFCCSLFFFFSLLHVMLWLQGNWEHTVHIFKKRLKHQQKKYCTMKMKTMCKYLWNWIYSMNLLGQANRRMLFLVPESQQDRRKF